MKAIDLEGYYRVPADLRDHDYDESLTEELKLEAQSYSSNNTNILTGEALDKLLMSQSYIVNTLKRIND